MASNFGLSTSHEEQIVSVLRFSRQKRIEALKSIENAFQGVVESRLLEDTYTLEEVKEILTSLEAVTQADVESELIYLSHVSVLVLKQACEQAEKWHLKLATNVSELENRDEIQKVANFEAVMFNDEMKLASSMPGVKKLEPLSEAGGAPLLQMEIDRLKQENKRLSSRLSQAESTVTDALEKKDKLQKQLSLTEQSRSNEIIASNQDAEVAGLKLQLLSLERELSSLRPEPLGQASSSIQLEGELEDKCKELLLLNSELETLKTEMDKKFVDTSQYSNMKKMLTSKNDQIKQLRDRLRKTRAFEALTRSAPAVCSGSQPAACCAVSPCSLLPSSSHPLSVLSLVCSLSLHEEQSLERKLKRDAYPPSFTITVNYELNDA